MSLLTSVLVSCALCAVSGAGFMFAVLKAAGKIKKSTDHVLKKEEN